MRWVLALVLETFYKYPLYSLYCTNQPQTIALPFKEKKEKAWHFVPNFLVDQITYIETCNPNEWIIYQSLGLVVQIGRITHWAIITFFPLLDLMPCKLLSTGKPSFIALSFFFLLCFTDNAFFVFFMNWRFYGNPESSKSIHSIFPTAFAHFMSQCHILVILAIFKAFSCLYLSWWSVISDLWCYYDSLKAQMVSIF